MALTRKDYEAIASAIQRGLTLPPSSRHSTLKQVAEQMSINLRAVNPAFNHALFIRACGFPTKPENDVKEKGAQLHDLK